MAVFDNTALDNTINEVWDMEVDDARYANAVVMPRVLNKSSLVEKSGDIINLNYKQRYSSGDVTAATGAFTPSTITPQKVQVTVDQWKYVAVETVDKSEAQSFWDPKSDFPKDAGAVLAETYDNALLDLDTNLTTNVVNSDANSPTTFSETEMLAAMLKLADLNVPKDSLSWILPPVAFYKGIATKPDFVNANRTGLPKSILLTNYRFRLLDIPTYESTLCNSAGVGNVSRTGLLIHKSVFAIAMQKNNEIKRAEATASGKLSSIVIVNSLFGVKTFREDHGVRVHITAS